MPEAAAKERTPEELWEAIATAWAWAEAFARPQFPPGVYKHRTVEAWNAQTDEWERQRIARARERVVDE